MNRYRTHNCSELTINNSGDEVILSGWVHKKRDPGNLLLCTIIIPPSAIILNAIFINEMIKIHEFIGMLIIIFGLLILDGRIFKKIKEISLFRSH